MDLEKLPFSDVLSLPQLVFLPEEKNWDSEFEQLAALSQVVSSNLLLEKTSSLARSSAHQQHPICNVYLQYSEEDGISSDEAVAYQNPWHNCQDN